MSPPHAGPSASPSERYWHACGGPCAGIPEFVYMLPDFPTFSFSLRAWLMCSHAKVRSSEAVTWPPLVPSFAFAAFLGLFGAASARSFAFSAALALAFARPSSWLQGPVQLLPPQLPSPAWLRLARPSLLSAQRRSASTAPRGWTHG